MKRPQRKRRAPKKFEAGSSSEHAKELKERLGKTFRYKNSVPIRRFTSEETAHSATPSVRSNGAGSIVKEVSKRYFWRRIGGNTLAQLCDEAVRRNTVKAKPSAKRYECPLSEEFIRARIEVDELVQGWMVFEAKSGLLQGFLTLSHFTTWVHKENFKWENSPYYVERNEVYDLVQALNSCERSGDPFGKGCVWRQVAEVTVFGAMGCGGLLLQEVLSQLRSGKLRNVDDEPFRYLVLQATKNAEPFYARQGLAHLFCRAKHFLKRADGTVDSKVGPWLPYRHFEYTATDTEPSYMMGLDLSSPVPPRAKCRAKWRLLKEEETWPTTVLRRYFKTGQQLSVQVGIQPLQKPRTRSRRGKSIARALTDSPHFTSGTVGNFSNYKENFLGDNDANDDFCSKCSLGGVLLCCDKCSKSYHLACVGLKELPSGDWICESHSKTSRPKRKRRPSSKFLLD